MARDKHGNHYPTSGGGWKEPKRPVAKRKIEAPKITQSPEKTILYFAYGSNLSYAHMARRCPAARPVGPLVVADGRLTFRGMADVVGVRGWEVAGGIWRITRQCERELDRCEGVASRIYMKRFLTLAVDGGEPEDCLFYQMRTSRGIMPPPDYYIETIARGYADFGLDTAYLDQALSDAWSHKEVTPALREKHRKRGFPTLARAVPELED